MTQCELFTARPGPVAGRLRYDVPAQPVQTSREAARRMVPKAPSIRAEVLAYVRSQGARGATDREIWEAVRGAHPAILEGTVRARRVEMTDGDIVNSGQRRDGMTVWIAREI